MNNQMGAVLNFLLKNNPNIQNNPMAQSMLQVIESGNSAQGEQIADNLCRNYGVTREQAVQQAQSWLNGMMGRR